MAPKYTSTINTTMGDDDWKDPVDGWHQVGSMVLGPGGYEVSAVLPLLLFDRYWCVPCYL